MCVDLFRKPSFKVASSLESSLLEDTCLIKLNLHLGKRTGKNSASVKQTSFEQTDPNN